MTRNVMEEIVTVIPIGYAEMNRADLNIFVAHGQEMVDQGFAGACLPLETVEGQIVVALMDPISEYPLCVFGKSQGWYFALDSDWSPIAQGQLIEEVLTVLPDALSQPLPRAANAV